MKNNKKRQLYSLTVALIVYAGFVPFLGRAQTNPKPNTPTLSFQNLKMQAHSGDSVSFGMAQIAVPENRLSAKTNTIQLAILKLNAKTTNSNYPIVFLAGGPGQSGVNYIEEEYFQKLIFQLQQNHDIILLDQRGSGRSLPSLTYKIPESDKKGLFLSPKSLIALADLASKAGADTLRKKGIDITGYNTIQNADDLNDLRIALGEEKINLLAISYGTHLALAAARKYPNLINNMVLIGTSGPDHMHHLPSTYNKQLKAISELAAQDTTVNQQVPDMVKLLRNVLAKLDQKPIQVQVKDNKTRQLVNISVGKFGLQMLLRLDAGDSNDFSYFPALLYGIEKGDFTVLQRFLQKRFNQFNGDYASGISVIRSASGASQSRYHKIAAEGKTALLGNAMNTPDIYAKNNWGNIDLGADFRKSFKSKIRTLFISGTMDSNTPPSNAAQVKKGFSNSAHLLVKYAGHEDILPQDEVQQAIIKFYNGKDLNVKSISLPKPKFIAILNK